MNWARCDDVESDPVTVSGAWVIKGARVQADSIVENARDGYSAEEIVERIFPSVPLDGACRVIAFARSTALSRAIRNDRFQKS